MKLYHFCFYWFKETQNLLSVIIWFNPRMNTRNSFESQTVSFFTIYFFFFFVSIWFSCSTRNKIYIFPRALSKRTLRVKLVTPCMAWDCFAFSHFNTYSHRNLQSVWLSIHSPAHHKYTNHLRVCHTNPIWIISFNRFSLSLNDSLKTPLKLLYWNQHKYYNTG